MVVAIHPVAKQHLQQLQQVAKETFYQTFIHETTEQNMSAYLDEVFSLKQLEEQFNNNNITLFLAVVGEVVAGYVKLNAENAQTELRESTGIEIERLYVRKQFQGKGVADKLMERAIETAVQLNKAYIWLGVAETNVKAVKFYSKHSFKVFGEHEFLLGGEHQIDLMMKRVLT